MTARPVMVVDGVEYVEAPETRWCGGCDFNANERRCRLAEDRSPGIFGGTCGDRNVIYIRADSAATGARDEPVMPPLPEPRNAAIRTCGVDGFTADQLRAYAIAAIELNRNKNGVAK